MGSKEAAASFFAREFRKRRYTNDCTVFVLPVYPSISIKIPPGAQGIDQRRPVSWQIRGAANMVVNPRSERRARHEAQTQAGSIQPGATDRQGTVVCLVDAVVLIG